MYRCSGGIQPICTHSVELSHEILLDQFILAPLVETESVKLAGLFSTLSINTKHLAMKL